MTQFYHLDTCTETNLLKDQGKISWCEETGKPGSRGTFLYHGKFCNVDDVVVRAIPLTNTSGEVESNRDLIALLSILKSPDLHRNIARYFHHFKDTGGKYL